MNIQSILAASIMALCCVSCDRDVKPPEMKVYHNGNEYEIVERGDSLVEGDKTYFVRYYSADPTDERVRINEQADILALVAKHVDTNKHQRIEIIAVERRGRFFGIMAPREHSESHAVDDVLKLKPVEKSQGQE